MKLTKNCKLLFIGDSITDCGRARPVGEGSSGGLGTGYVALVDALLGAVYPDLAIRVVNTGTSGHTVRDLAGRWQTDVLDLKPDWAVIMIGINDVWRQFDAPRMPEIHVGLSEYEETLEHLMAQTRPQVEGMVLMTPFYIEPHAQDAMRARMDQYGAAVRQLASIHHATLVDTQAAFLQVLEHCHPTALAGDRVHPNLPGHMVLARAFLDAVGFEWK